MHIYFKLILAYILCLSIYANTTYVSMDNSDTQASDLFHPEFGVIDPEFAKELASAGNNISLLNPVHNDLWDGKDKFNEVIDDLSLPVKNMDTLFYKGSIDSNSGIFRYNVVNSGGEKFLIHMAKNIHTYLLRKNLLRKLGYFIPRVKYLNNIKIVFKSNEEKVHFKDIELFSALAASSARWIVEEGDDYLILQDIAVKMPSEVDGSDIALTMIPNQLSARSLRGALVAYNLVNMDESINKLSYQAVTTQEALLVIDHATEAQFNASRSDLEWMVKKVAKLSRSDFEDIVAQANYPYVVSKLLVERLISRRNSWIAVLELDEKPMDYVKDLKLDGVKDGFLNTEKFEGYATQFSYGVQKGPLDDIWRYVVVETQSSLISSGMDKLNSYLKAYNVGEAKFDWLVDDFTKNKDYAIEYFTEHGEFPELPVSTWNSPIANGNLILGRDIVIGGALGTDNFVQLADSAGVAITLGMHFGVERLFSQLATGSVLPNIGAVLSYTHVKPVTSMKEALKEPYENIFVNWLTQKLFDEVKDIEKTKIVSVAEREEKIKKIFSNISEQLGIGESLIISESITPDVSATLRLPVLEMGTISGTAGMKYKKLKRIQILRKSKFNFDIYFDNGGVVDLYTRGSFNYYIPVFLGEAKAISGKMYMKHFTIDLNPNTTENPDFYKNALRFISIVKDRNEEAIESSNLKVETEFNDRAGKFSIFFYVNKWVKKLTKILVKYKNYKDTKYVSSTYGNQSGFNYLDFIKQVANYFLAKEFRGIALDVDTFKNPGRAIYGSSYTTDVKFEAKLKDISKKGDIENFEVMYAEYERRSEGGSVEEDRLWKKMKDVNRHFRRDVFTKEHSRDAGDLSLYKIESKLHLYDKAIKKILSLKNSDIKKLEDQALENLPKQCAYKKKIGNLSATLAGRLRCGDYSYLYDLKNRCLEKFYDNEIPDGQKCMSRLVYYFAHYVELDSLINLVGEDNIYIESSVNGFRKNHEYIYKPVSGNSYGRRNSKFRNGPFEEIRNFLGVLGGEFDGSWFREKL